MMRGKGEDEVTSLYRSLGVIAVREYSDIVLDVEVREDRLRIHLVDGSFLDVWFSRRKPGKYAFHWERRHVNGTIYRWDNAEHKSMRSLPTYPHHMHEGSRENVKPFMPEATPDNTFRKIMEYVRRKLGKHESRP